MVEDVPRPPGMPAFGGGGGGKPPHDGHPPEPDGDPEEEEEEEEGKGKGKGGGGGGPGAGFHGMPFPPLPRLRDPWMPQLYLDLRCSTLALLKRRASSTTQSLTGLQT